MNDTSHPTPLDLFLSLSDLNAMVVEKLNTLQGLSFSEFNMLLHIYHQPQAKMRRIDLAQKVHFSASGVTRALLPLEKLGIVGREPDPRDARVSHVLLTPAGKDLVQNALGQAEEVSKDMLQSFSTLPELYQHLNTLKQALRR